MDFVKGALMGIIAGTIVGTMNSNTILGMLNRGKRQVRKIRRKYSV